MKKKNNPAGFFSPGAPLLLVVLLTLSLCLFAALSISTAKNSLTLTERTSARKTEYYEASNAAEEITAYLMAQIEEPTLNENAVSNDASAIFDANESGVSSDTTADLDATVIDEGIDAETQSYMIDTEEKGAIAVTQSGNTYTFSIPINETQDLQVVLTDDEEDITPTLAVTEWRIQNR